MCIRDRCNTAVQHQFGSWVRFDWLSSLHEDHHGSHHLLFTIYHATPNPTYKPVSLRSYCQSLCPLSLLLFTFRWHAPINVKKTVSNVIIDTCNFWLYSSFFFICTDFIIPATVSASGHPTAQCHLIISYFISFSGSLLRNFQIYNSLYRI